MADEVTRTMLNPRVVRCWSMAMLKMRNGPGRKGQAGSEIETIRGAKGVPISNVQVRQGTPRFRNRGPTGA